LRRRHRIQANQDNDFSVRSLNEVAAAFENVSQVMTLLPRGGRVDLAAGWRDRNHEHHADFGY
jgi:hypothetical protein